MNFLKQTGNARFFQLLNGRAAVVLQPVPQKCKADAPVLLKTAEGRFSVKSLLFILAKSKRREKLSGGV